MTREITMRAARVVNHLSPAAPLLENNRVEVLPRHMAATTPGPKAVLTGLVRVATPPYKSSAIYHASAAGLASDAREGEGGDLGSECSQGAGSEVPPNRHGAVGEAKSHARGQAACS